MKYFGFTLFILVLTSCSAQDTSRIVKQKALEASELEFSKLPPQKVSTSLLSILKQFELDENLSESRKTFKTKFFGQNLYNYAYTFDTVVNKTHVVLIYNCIGGENEDIVNKRILEDLNLSINEMIESAKIQAFPILYSIVSDEIVVEDNLILTREVRFFTGGAGESSNMYKYSIDGINMIDFLEDYNLYRAESDFLQDYLTGEISD